MSQPAGRPISALRRWVGIVMTLSVVAALLGLTAGVVGATTTSVEALRDGYDAVPASRVEHADGGRRTDPADTTSPRPCLDPRSIGLVAATRQQIATNSVGGGSGPWVDDALTAPRPGAVRPQSAGGSCVSACGEVLSGGARTESQLLGALGEWSNPQALARELGSGWTGGGFGSGADAVAAANRGPMGAVLQAPGGPGHMVVTSPLGGGRFQVLDPFDGTGYVVDSSWIERYVSGGVFR